MQRGRIDEVDAPGVTRRALRRPSRIVPVVVALVASLIIVIQPAAAEWSQPAFVTTVGGTGRPGVFAWGLQYNPVSDEFRDKRMQRAEELAAKMGTKLVFPLVLFMFPIFFIVAIGPAVIRIIDAFSQV